MNNPNAIDIEFFYLINDEVEQLPLMFDSSEFFGDYIEMIEQLVAEHEVNNK